MRGRGAAPEEWAGTLQRFLADQQRALPPGALEMRWICNHDTVSRTLQKRWSLDLHGVGRMRVCRAFCVLIEGCRCSTKGTKTPEIYGGRSASNVESLRQLYEVRQGEPAPRAGWADYVSVRATGGVFACPRTLGGRMAVVLIGFNPEPMATASAGADLPEGADLPPPAGPWHGAMTGEPVAADAEGRVMIAPHQVRVLLPTRMNSPGPSPRPATATDEQIPRSRRAG